MAEARTRIDDSPPPSSKKVEDETVRPGWKQLDQSDIHSDEGDEEALGEEEGGGQVDGENYLVIFSQLPLFLSLLISLLSPVTLCISLMDNSSLM